VLGIVGAVEAGVALWSFTNGRWANGIVYTIGVALVAAVFVRAQRKSKGRDGGRRY
jgi:hypothetical protein